MDILFELVRVAPAGVYWMPVMLIMLKRLLDSGFIVSRHTGVRIRSSGMDQSPITLHVTDKGSKFINELGIAEL